MKALVTIQTRLKAPKGQHNAFGNYNYRSCEDILEALKPLLDETQTALTLTDGVELVGDRFYIKATATLYDLEGKAIAASVGMAREPLSRKGQDESQVTGSASSYARKYALNGLFAIDDTKDPDATNKHGKDQPAAGTGSQAKQAGRPGATKAGNGKKITDKQAAYLYSVASTYGISDKSIHATIKKYFNLDHVKQLNSEQMNRLLKAFGEKRGDAPQPIDQPAPAARQETMNYGQEDPYHQFDDAYYDYEEVPF